MKSVMGAKGQNGESMDERPTAQHWSWRRKEQEILIHVDAKRGRSAMDRRGDTRDVGFSVKLYADKLEGGSGEKAERRWQRTPRSLSPFEQHGIGDHRAGA